MDARAVIYLAVPQYGVRWSHQNTSRCAIMCCVIAMRSTMQCYDAPRAAVPVSVALLHVVLHCRALLLCCLEPCGAVLRSVRSRA